MMSQTQHTDTDSQKKKKFEYTPDPNPGWLWNFIDRTLTWRENREKHCVNRKTYLLWCLLGVFGAHRFYEKRPIQGLVYLATCWSGFSAAMTLLDAIIVIPMKPDENGNIWL